MIQPAEHSGPRRTLRSASRELVSLIGQHAVDERITNSDWPRLSFGRANSTVSRFPMVYEPCLCVVAQGRKLTYVGGETFLYDPLNYLVVSLSLPAEGEIVMASSEEPFLSLVLRLDLAAVGKLVIEMANYEHEIDEGFDEVKAICASPMHEGLLDAVVRFLRIIRTPLDRRILGAAAEREVLYQVLLGEQGESLRNLALRDGVARRVAGIAERLQRDCACPLDISTIAKKAGMGESTLHHSFKRVVGMSPIQYLKKTRLHRARLLIVSDGLNSGEAAYRVGYNSPSQFSREFKRMFGVPPSRAAESL